MTATNNAVIYARYSSHGQNEQTIEGQIRKCSEYAASRKLNIVNYYVDKHRSGTDDKRPEFQKMIEDAKSGTFSYIIVYMLDRFARNRYHSTIYRWQLEQCGVKVVSATENISESEEGEFFQMFLEWNAEKYSTRLSKRVKEGLTTSVANGTYEGGYLIYGYKKDGKRLVVEEEQAEVIKYIYSEYIKGISKKDIATALNAKGSRYKGNPWQARNFDRILANPKYTGEFMFGERLCQNTYPPIIDKETFDKAQKRAVVNKHASGSNSAKEPYLLQGKIFCGLCGSPMTADGGTSHTGVQHHYYSCVKKKKTRTCPKDNEKKGFIEWYVTEQTVNYLSNPNRVSIIADDVIRYFDNRVDSNEIRRLATEKAKVKQEIDNAINLMISGVSAVVVRNLEEKLVQLNALFNDLSEHQAKLELERGLRVSKSDIMTFVAEFIKGELHDKNFQKRIIDNLINAVYLYDEKIVIYFSINGGKETAFIGKDETDEVLSTLDISGSNFNAFTVDETVLESLSTATTLHKKGNNKTKTAKNKKFEPPFNGSNFKVTGGESGI